MNAKAWVSTAARSIEISKLEAEAQRVEMEMKNIEGKFKQKALEVQNLKEGHEIERSGLEYGKRI